MNPQPMDEADFNALVPDEAAAMAIFAKWRWGAVVTCDACGSEMKQLSTRPIWQCKAPQCRKQTSLRAGTVLHGTRVPLRDILYMVWASSGRITHSAAQIARTLQYRYETVWTLLHKIRAAMAERGAWPLLEPVSVAAATLRPTKVAKGDPPPRTPVVVALAVRDVIIDAPGQDTLRIQPQTDPAQSDRSLIDDAVAAHVDPGVVPEVVGARMDGGLVLQASFMLRSQYRALQVWLRRRFGGGVSKKYLFNYLAQYAYLENRWPAGWAQMFAWMGRRVAREPWLPRSNMALFAP